MKILFVMNHVDQGGAALALYDLIKELLNYKDIECVVITGKKNSLNQKLDAIGIKNYSFNFKNFMSSYSEPILFTNLFLRVRYFVNCRSAMKRIEENLEMNSVDLIHTNLNRIDMGAILSCKYGIPHIWHIREHGESDFRMTSVIKNPISYMNQFDSYFIMISKSVKETWERRGLKQDKMHLIYDGVRTELYDRIQNEYKKGEILQIIFLGGYTASKGQEEFIEAINLLSEKSRRLVHADLFGNGKKHYQNKLKKKIRDYKLNDIIGINGYRDDIWKRMKLYDIGMNCSNAEGFGRVTVEYMLSGLCPIVSNAGANKEIVHHGITGYVYQKGNVEQLRGLIEYLIENRSQVIRIAVNASKVAHEKFSMKKHANEVYKLYKDIINRDWKND